jgi:hypothetical protein
MKKFVGIAGLVATALFIHGCSTSNSAAKTSADLTGLWQVTLPNGYQQMMRVTSEGGQKYRLWKSNMVFNGVYERRGDKLVMITPADPRLTEFVWQIDAGNHLTLIKEPAVAKTGQRYRKATLLKTG